MINAKMASNDGDFIHVSTDSSIRHGVSSEFFSKTQGTRWFTEGQIVDSLRRAYPHHHLTVNLAFTCDLIGFANSRDDISYKPRDNDTSGLVERQFIPPMRRYNDEANGAFIGNVVFGSFDYVFEGKSFLVYKVAGHDGSMYKTVYNYILVAPSKAGEEMNAAEKVEAQKNTDDLIAAGTKWMLELHDEVLVFDQGFWMKNKGLWSEIQRSNWEDVILEEEKKKNIIDDVLGFFDAQERYAEFGVPWKRGVIFYGPPGNGKTISTKSLMHDVSKQLNPTIESLYVKSFTSFGGPEYGIRAIFSMARQMAPCLLILEDIDSLVSPLVRSYFLNEVDGLESNHGILMIASTNHLEQLDPGIAKRPSRFDRKYVFENPTHGERVQYCDYWRNKLKDNKKVDFPEEMSAKVADITDDFSFAYMKEAFVAALLVIVAKRDVREGGGGDGLSGNVLWEELKKQISALRKEMDDESGSRAEKGEGKNANEATGSLPRGWEQKMTPQGKPYFVDHITKQTTWARPVAALEQPTAYHDRHPIRCLEDPAVGSSMGSMRGQFYPFLDEIYSDGNISARMQMQAQEAAQAVAQVGGQPHAQMLPPFQLSPRYM